MIAVGIDGGKRERVDARTRIRGISLDDESVPIGEQAVGNEVARLPEDHLVRITRLDSGDARQDAMSGRAVIGDRDIAGVADVDPRVARAHLEGQSGNGHGDVDVGRHAIAGHDDGGTRMLGQLAAGVLAHYADLADPQAAADARDRRACAVVAVWVIGDAEQVGTVEPPPARLICVDFYVIGARRRRRLVRHALVTGQESALVDWIGILELLRRGEASPDCRCD